MIYIASGSTFADVTRFRQLCPELDTAETVGTGYVATLEVPEQMNDPFMRTLGGCEDVR